MTKFTFDKSSAVSILESCTLFIISIWGAVSPKVSNRAFGNSSVPLTFSIEGLWCKKASNDTYIVDNVPFYIYGISLGDEIFYSYSGTR